jgi:hypothetical protein
MSKVQYVLSAKQIEEAKHLRELLHLPVAGISRCLSIPYWRLKEFFRKETDACLKTHLNL